MKILIVNTTEKQGGAGIAAHRLYMGLQNNGIDAKMLVLQKQTDDENVIALYDNWFINKLKSKFHKYHRKIFSPKVNEFSDIFSINHIIKKVKSINPDIIHLHWINSSFFNLNDLAKLKIPIVWSLHDMWAFTGGCHYDKGCGRYKNNCLNYPLLNNTSIASNIFKKKKTIYDKIPNLTIIGLSKWLSYCAKESFLFKNRKVINLPNCIDTNIFKPKNTKELRKKLNIPMVKKILLFGAMNPNQPRKGGRLLYNALKYLNAEKYEVIIVGKSSFEINNLSLKIHFTGNIKDENEMISYLSLANATILPSIQENLSNMVIESLSCGTPVVAFNIGGNKDMIEHKQNGYLVKNINSHDLANGIKWVTDNKLRNKELSYNSRKKVLDNYKESILIPKYIIFYEKILNAKNI